jgi:hypothetical protein
MIEIPLSQLKALYSAAPNASAAEIASYLAASLKMCRSAFEAHVMGPPGRAAPIVDPLFEALIQRVPETGPVADRGPDKFVIAPYTIVDDTPLPAEAQQALAVLRETISG